MNFFKHSNLEGKHARLSPSSWRWLNDDPAGLARRVCATYATEIGTILHRMAARHIQYSVKLNRYDKKNMALELLSNGIPAFVVDQLELDPMFDNLASYVNDGIGFRMKPEVVLYYSDSFFGTADAISYTERERFLRIHDYKSGTTPAHMEQLMIYAALFCLEYRFKPRELGMELRIYQSSESMYHNPEPDEIGSIMEKIVTFDKFLNQVNKKEG